MRSLGLVTLAFSAALLTACGSVETVNPVGATTTTDTTTDTTPIPDGGPPKRTIALRNPLAGPAGNLLLDGDFELSTGPYPGQYGWRMFNSSGTGEVRMFMETGGLCRTGLSCAKVHKGELLFGRGTAAAYGKGHIFEAWAKMPEGTGCAKISVLAVTCDTFIALKKASVDKDPENGWCHHHGTLPPLTASVCLYIQPSLMDGDEALMDSAVLAPNDGTVPFKSTPEDDAPIDAETQSRLVNLRDTLLRTTPFGTPPTEKAPRRD